MLVDDPRINTITRDILGAAIEVHRQLGPGLLESIYATCLQYELTTRGMRFVRHRSMPVTYKGVLLDSTYQIDLVVEDRVVVEIKCVSALAPVHEAQTLTYLRLSGHPAALLINFNVPRLMDGVRRLLNTRQREISVDTVLPQIGGHTETDGDGGSTGRPA